MRKRERIRKRTGGDNERISMACWPVALLPWFVQVIDATMAQDENH
jgi:hypothetical protein